MAARLAILFLALLWPAGSFPASDSIKIIFFPLDSAMKDSSLSWLNQGIAHSISRQLQARDVTVVKRKEREFLVENMDLPPGAQLSHASMIRAAQKADADMLVMGTYSGTRQNLKISLKALDVKTMKLSGDMVANGPVTALAQMENELAWLVLNNTGLGKNYSREKFLLKTRKAPNQAYRLFIESFSSASESDRMNLLLKALQSYGKFSEARLQLAGIYFRKENCVNAVPHLDLENGDGSEDPEKGFMRGTCFIQEDLNNQAVQMLTGVLSISRFPEAFNNLGVAYLNKGDYGLALNALLEARNLNSADSTVALNLALVRHLQRNDWAAKNSLDEAVKLHPRDGMLHFLNGFILKMQGEKEKATAAFSKAKNLGVNVEKLQTQNPKSWARLIYEFPSSMPLP